MGNILTGSVVFMLVAQIFILAAGSPASAITADLEKNALNWQLKRTPPNRTGNRAYAQAERDFFANASQKMAIWRTTALQRPPS